MKRYFLLAIIIIFLPSLGFSQDVLNDLMSSKSLVCEFPVGTFANWNGDILALESDRISGLINFDNIDLKGKKARMIGKAGAQDVIVLTFPSGLTFIESTSLGNMIYITVFPTYLGKKTIKNASIADASIKAQLPKAFLAVISSHVFDSAITHLPMPAQSHGYCRKLE